MKIAVTAALLVIVAGAANAAEFRSLPGATFQESAIVEGPRCATPEPDAGTAALVESTLAASRRTVLSQTTVEIPVAVHMITAGKKGKYSRPVVDLLINNLNASFSGTGLSFYLVKLDYTNKKAWYESCALLGRNEAAMKKKLAYYPARVLNIYSCKPTGKGLPANIIGYAYFPWLLPENHYLQGVVVHPGTLPTGAGIPGYDYYGLNAVHEVGHWLGLFHTFQDGCSGTDYVNDTPAQEAPTYACAIGHDSCSSHAGLDDVPNFMNYVDDHCYDHFSAGQVERMWGALDAYRPSLFN